MCVGLMGVETQLYMEYPHIYMGLYGLNMDYIYIWENNGGFMGKYGTIMGKQRLSGKTMREILDFNREWEWDYHLVI